MYGINGRPNINLDPFIDVAGFQALHDKMCEGLAKAEWMQGSYGPGVFNKKDLKRDGFFLERLINSGQHPDALKIKEHGFKTYDQFRKYTKLKYKLYNPSHTVYLRRPQNFDYNSIDSEPRNDWMNVDLFPEVVAWVKRLPLESIGRVLFFIHEHDCALIMHSDNKHNPDVLGTSTYVANNPHKNEFVWIRPNEDKKFFVYDEATAEKHYIEGASGFFNSYDVHGGDPSPMMTYSLRVDGVFTPELRSQLGL